MCSVRDFISKRMVWESPVKLTPEQRAEGGETVRPRHVLKEGSQGEERARGAPLRQGMPAPSERPHLWGNHSEQGEQAHEAREDLEINDTGVLGFCLYSEYDG